MNLLSKKASPIVRKILVLATKKEIEFLNEKRTLVREKLPCDKKSKPRNGNYKKKLNVDGSVEKFKARLVVKEEVKTTMKQMYKKIQLN